MYEFLAIYGASINPDALIAAISAIVTAAFVQLVVLRQTKAKEKVDTSQVIFNERVALDQEARKLREEIREELAKTRAENDKLDQEISQLKIRVAGLEAELWEWRTGRRHIGDHQSDYPYDL